MLKRRFQCGLCWNQVKYARITITHVCFIAWTFAGSLGRCLNTWPNSLVLKQLPLDPVNVNAWKNMSDAYINICNTQMNGKGVGNIPNTVLITIKQNKNKCLTILFILERNQTLNWIQLSECIWIREIKIVIVLARGQCVWWGRGDI